MGVKKRIKRLYRISKEKLNQNNIYQYLKNDFRSNPNTWKF